MWQLFSYCISTSARDMATPISKFWEPWKSNFRFTGFWTSLSRLWGLIWFSGLPSNCKYQNKLTYGNPENKDILKFKKCWDYTSQILPQVIKKLSLSFTAPDCSDTYNSETKKICFLITCDKIQVDFDTCSILLIFWKYLFCQGSHMWANSGIYNYMVTLKIKSDPISVIDLLWPRRSICWSPIPTHWFMRGLQ